MKILGFKTVSPLFEMERDGIKPFTTRKIDYKDKRHRALAQWKPDCKWGIKIINPMTQESFIRQIIGMSYVGYHKDYQVECLCDWRIIVMGELLSG